MWWNPELSHRVLPRMWIILLSWVSHYLYTQQPRQLSDWQSIYHGACVQVILVLLNNGSKAQEEWCWPFKSAKEEVSRTYFKWKGKISQPNEEREKLYAEVAKINRENISSIHEVVKKEKETRASFAAVFETAKVTVTVTVGSECLVKMEEALNLYNKLFWDRLRETTFT